MNRQFLAGAAASMLLLAPITAFAKGTAENAPAAAAAAPSAEPAAATPAPASTPAAVCAPRNATVYFETNSTTLTQDADRAIAQSATAPEACSIQSVTLTGFTDARGDADYNRALAERRSAAVRDVLVREGVQASVIDIDARGEVVQSADPSRDRRVEVQVVLAQAVAEPAAPAGGS